MVMDREELSELSDEQLQEMVDNRLLCRVGKDMYEMTEYEITKKGIEFLKREKEQGII